MDRLGLRILSVALILVAGRGLVHAQSPWSVVDDTPSWIDSNGVVMTGNIQYHGGAIVNGQMILFGGNSPSTSWNTYRYDLSQPPMGTWLAGQALPKQLSAMGCVVLGGLVYSIGGLDPNIVALKDVYVYDPATDQWTAVASLNTARLAPACAVVSGRIYACGGLDASLNPTASVEEYDPVANAWTPKQSMSAPLAWACVGSISNKIYVAGGQGAAANSSATWEFDPAAGSSGTWTAKRSMDLDDARLATGVTEGQSAVVGGSLFCFGGALGSGAQYPGTIEYRPSLDSWVVRTDLPVYASDGRAMAAGGKAYISGGSWGSLVHQYTLEAAPPADTSIPTVLDLEQVDSTGAAIPPDGLTHAISIYLQASIEPAAGRPFRIEAEIVTAGTPFTGTPNVVGSLVPGSLLSGAFTLPPGFRNYEWRARVSDGTAAPGAWIPYGIPQDPVDISAEPFIPLGGGKNRSCSAAPSSPWSLALLGAATLGILRRRRR